MHRDLYRASARWRGDAGNAIIEFLLVPLLLVPLVGLFIHVVVKVRLEAALDDAARNALRAYAVSAKPSVAVAAAKLSLADESLIGSARVGGSPVTITITARVRPLGLVVLKGSRVQVLS